VRWDVLSLIGNADHSLIRQRARDVYAERRMQDAAHREDMWNARALYWQHRALLGRFRARVGQARVAHAECFSCNRVREPCSAYILQDPGYLSGRRNQDGYNTCLSSFCLTCSSYSINGAGNTLEVASGAGKTGAEPARILRSRLCSSRMPLALLWSMFCERHPNGLVDACHDSCCTYLTSRTALSGRK